MKYNIEVCVGEGCNTTEKGALLEELTAKILETQQYTVVNTIRVTGMELDVLAQHNFTGERIIVECKAWDSNLPADVISKLLGNVMLRNVSSGWLVTTGPLGKDAAGIKSEWEEKPSEERRKLAFFTSDRIIRLLISSHIILSSESINNVSTMSDEHTLLISNLGRFWIIPIVNIGGGIATSVAVFDAQTGQRINDEQLLSQLRQLKTAFSEYAWIADDIYDEEVIKQIKDEYENIVTVMGGDDWKDYRPSRPEDFVGRANLLKEIYSFFDNVKSNKSEVRLFSIKSPSGWGKSSTVLKIASMAESRRRSKQYFIYAVDVRTALTGRYAELALKSCFEAAIDKEFINYNKTELMLGNINSLFETLSVQAIIKQLKEQNKLIVLIFDQFEEIFSKKELAGLFDTIRRLSNSIDALKENIILGFAWKTDLTIPAEHPAYYLWSNLSERRKEFDLQQFKESEVKSAIAVFGRQLGEDINPVLSRYLARQCQGYPWLLKKLCIHVYKLIEEGYDQEAALGQRLNIKELFERDLNDLSPQEYACITEIAQNSPADYFKIIEIYGQDSLQSLINRRTVIRRSSKLILYWDIFRDYVLNKTIPTIVLDYIPQMQFPTFRKVISALLNKHTTDATELGEKTCLGEKTLDNVMLDLAMLGVVKRDKKNIILLYNNEEEISKCIQEFFSRHIIFTSLQILQEKPFNYTYFEEVFMNIYAKNSINAKTKILYCSKLLDWLICLDMVIENSNEFVLNPQKYKAIDFKVQGGQRSPKRRRTNKRGAFKETIYWPQCSPERIIDAYNTIIDGERNRNILKDKYKSAIEDLHSLRLIYFENSEAIINQDISSLKSYIKNLPNIKYIEELINENKNIKSKEVGKLVNEKFMRNWSEGSERRYGNYLLKWTKYVLNLE